MNDGIPGLILAGVVSLATGVTGGYVVYRLQRRADIGLAQRTGQFDEGELALVVQGRTFLNHQSPPLHWVHVIVPGAANRTITELEVCVANTGEKALKDVSMSIRVPKEHAALGNNRVVSGFMPGSKRKRVIEGNFCRSYTYAKSLPPGRAMSYIEELQARPTELNDMRVPHPGDENVELSISANYSVIISVDSHSRVGNGPSADVRFHVLAGEMHDVLKLVTSQIDRDEEKMFNVGGRGPVRWLRHRRFHRERPSRGNPILVTHHTKTGGKRSAFELHCFGAQWGYLVDTDSDHDLVVI